MGIVSPALVIKRHIEGLNEAMDASEEPESPSTAEEGLVTVPKATFIEDVGAFLAGA